MGAAYVQKDLFGWKADILTWSPMDSERNYDNDHLNGIQGQGENLFYGLIKHGGGRIVQVRDVADGGNRKVSIGRIVYLIS